MSKENNENFNINTQPPKRDNRVVILLSVILVVLFAIIIAIVSITVSMKNKELRDSAEKVFGFGTPTQSTTMASNVTPGFAQNEQTATQSPNTNNSVSQPEKTEAPVTTTTTAPSATKNDSSKPSNGVNALQYYNEAINKAVNAKVGYSKTRMSYNDKFEGSAALNAIKDLVFQFMGMGADNAYSATVAKGNWGKVAFLTKSQLTASDVASATCEVSGSNYVITLKLKNGASSASQSNPTTPANTALDKCGICVGSEEKAYYDHKTASAIYEGFSSSFSNVDIKENYSNAIVVAKVNSATGNLVSVKVEWNQAVSISSKTFSGKASSGVRVNYTNFKY